MPGREPSRGGYVAAALLAAALYALSAPLSKVLLARVAPNAMASLLYLGAGVGMAALTGARRLRGTRREGRALVRSDAPYVAAMVALDVAAPVLLMAGLARTAAENVSLLNNFEIVATALVALVFFHERVGVRLWAAIVAITCACVLLSVEDASALSFSPGSLLVLGACCCWGVENNCTNRLSDCDPAEVVVVKGLGSGAGTLVVALLAGDALPGAADALAAMAFGFVAYGLSIYFYVYAQRGLGAARTSAFYAVNPSWAWCCRGRCSARPRGRRFSPRLRSWHWARGSRRRGTKVSARKACKPPYTARLPPPGYGGPAEAARASGAVLGMRVVPQVFIVLCAPRNMSHCVDPSRRSGAGKCRLRSTRSTCGPPATEFRQEASPRVHAKLQLVDSRTLCLGLACPCSVLDYRQWR